MQSFAALLKIRFMQRYWNRFAIPVKYSWRPGNYSRQEVPPRMDSVRRKTDLSDCDGVYIVSLEGRHVFSEINIVGFAVVAGI